MQRTDKCAKDSVTGIQSVYNALDHFLVISEQSNTVSLNFSCLANSIQSENIMCVNVVSMVIKEWFPW